MGLVSLPFGDTCDAQYLFLYSKIPSKALWSAKLDTFDKFLEWVTYSNITLLFTKYLNQ